MSLVGRHSGCSGEPELVGRLAGRPAGPQCCWLHFKWHSPRWVELVSGTSLSSPSTGAGAIKRTTFFSINGKSRPQSTCFGQLMAAVSLASSPVDLSRCRPAKQPKRTRCTAPDRIPSGCTQPTAKVESQAVVCDSLADQIKCLLPRQSV